MRDLNFTLYGHVQDSKGTLKVQSWANWLDVFGKHQVRGEPQNTVSKESLERNKNGPAVVLGVVRGLRRASNVVEINALALDLEKKSDTELAEVLERIAEFEWILYSTHKHGAEVVDRQSRLRVVLPLAEPVAPADYAAAWEGLNAMVGGANDPSTSDLARLHFLPSTFDARLAIVHHNPGRWLSAKDLSAVAETTSQVTLDTDAGEVVEDRPVEEVVLLIRRKTQTMSIKDEIKGLTRKLIEGVSFAEPGERHSKVLTLTYWIATSLPKLNRRTLDDLFSRSLAAMATEKDAPTHEEIWRAYEGALARLEKDGKLKKRKTVEPPKFTPYSPEELQRIATRQGWKVEELTDKWIIQKDGSAWFLREDGDYDGPYSRDDISIAVKKFLLRAPVNIFLATPTGYKMRTTAEIVGDHGSLARKVVADLSAQITSYNPTTRVLREAVVPIRTDLKPTPNAKIDAWLQAMGGENYLKLCDWLTCCPDPSKQLCALYLDGSKESGKTLFALGAARLWTTGGPAEVEEVLANFNEELTRCPLVFADEELPKKYGGQSTSAKLRALLGIKERTLKRKYKTNADLTGALRLILAANNESLLDSLDASTPADLEAIAQRFLYIKIPSESADFLKSCTKAELDTWAARGIAEHALWLQANHKIERPGRRFWVEGDLTEIHRLLLTGGHWTSLLCDWLIRYLINPRPLHADAEVTGLVRIEDGALLVNEQVLADKWKLYLPNTKQDPQVRQIGHALRAISTQERRQLRWNRRRVRYRVVDPSHLIAWSERHGIGDEQLIRDRLSGAIPLTVSLESKIENIENRDSDLGTVREF